MFICLSGTLAKKKKRPIYPNPGSLATNCTSFPLQLTSYRQSPVEDKEKADVHKLTGSLQPDSVMSFAFSSISATCNPKQHKVTGFKFERVLDVII